MAYPDEIMRERILSNVADDFEEMLETLREGGAKSVRVKKFLKASLERYGLPYVCCFVGTALVTSTNCPQFLAISVI